MSVLPLFRPKKYPDTDYVPGSTLVLLPVLQRIDSVYELLQDFIFIKGLFLLNWL